MNTREQILISACRNVDMNAVEKVLENSLIEINCRECDTKYTPVHIAIEVKSLPLLEFLLSKKASVNYSSGIRGITPLILAVENRNMRAVEILLRHNADVTRANFKDETPLYIAVHYHDDSVDREDLISLILHYGSKCTKVDENYKKYYQLCVLLFENDFQSVFEFLKDFKIDIFDDLNEKSLLYYAVFKNRIKIAKLLIAKGVKLVDSTSLLCVAFRNRSVEMAEELLKNSAKFDIQKSPTTWFDLHPDFTETLFDQKIFHRVIKDLNIIDKDGHTLLHLACRDEKLINIKILLKYYPELLNVRGETGDSALHIAATKDSTGKIVKFLLKCKGVDVEAKNLKGKTAIQCACLYARNKNPIDAFIRWNFDILTIRDDQGCNLLHLAAQNQFSSEPLKFLLSLHELDVNCKNIFGNTPIQCKSTSMSLLGLFNYWLNCEKIELLVRHGADVNLKNCLKLVCS